jgi:hypothetical protein
VEDYYLKERTIVMNTKSSGLLILALAAMLFGGCVAGSGPTSPNLSGPIQPSFTQDASPDAPNYYWLTSCQFTLDDRAGAIYLRPNGGAARGLPPVSGSVESSTTH